MADVERKRVTLHPVKEDGTIDTSISLYPKTFVDGIVDRDGNEVDIALQNELDTKVADLNNKINLTNKAIGIFGTKIDELIENEAAFEERVSEKVEELADDIPAEVARAKAAEFVLDKKIDDTTTELNTKINTKISTVEEKIQAEAITRKALDISLNKKIEDETSRATEAETSLDTKIDEVFDSFNSALTSVDTRLTKAVRAESEARGDDKNELEDLIEAEEIRAKKAEGLLSTAIENTAGAVEDEEERATEAEETLDKKIDDEIERIEGSIEGFTGLVTAEEARATEAEETLSGQISGLGTRITNEVSTLNTAITNVQNSVNAEVSRATSQETILNAKIATEIADAKSELGESISSIADSLDTAIETLEAADSDLDTRLSTVEGDLTTEASTRSTADAGLQRQIDAMASRSDVVDVVATKAALDVYDKSTLFDNDVIKVLDDETQNNKTTYYKYTKANNSFNLIGSIGPYSTATNVTNGNDGSANVDAVSSNIKSITNKGYVDNAINTAKAETEAWEQEIQDMLNLRLGNIDENIAKVYYCNVFLKNVEAIECHGIKFGSSEEFTYNTDKADKGNVITSIKFSFKYNKLPRGCKLYFKELTNDIDFPTINATTEIDGEIVEVSEHIITGLNLSKTSMWQITLLSEYDGSISTKVVPVYICNKVYWGTATRSSLGGIQDIIWESELSPIFSTNKPVVSTNSRYIVYAFPVEDINAIDYGIPMFTLSPSQFIGGVSQYVLGEISKFDFTNSNNGYLEKYYIYISDNHSLGNITLKVERQ